MYVMLQSRVKRTFRPNWSAIRPNCQWLFQAIHEKLCNGTQIRLQELLMMVKIWKASTVQPLHAKWVMEVYNHMASSTGKEICLKGWKKSGIEEALENGLEDNLDTFKDTDPIEAADEVSNNLFVINKMYISQKNRDDDDWEDDDVFIQDDEGDD